MKEREAVMKKRAEDRLEKSRKRAEAAEKIKDEELLKEEERKKKRIQRAQKSRGAEATDENGNPLHETWEMRLEREQKDREDRKLKHKAVILSQRVPLTSSLEESINVYKNLKGRNAPEPGKVKITPFKATDPDTVSTGCSGRFIEKLTMKCVYYRLQRVLKGILRNVRLQD